MNMKRVLTVSIFVVIFTGLSAQDKLTDKRDGNVYRTITFAGVTWMAENLRYKTKDGASYFDNNSNNISDYGVLYDWKTATTVCPAGWHLPSGSDFRTLANYFEQKGTWGKNASDSSSFGLQFGGMHDYEGTFSEVGESCYFWTSTEYDSANAEYFSYLIFDGMPIIDISRPEDSADMHGTEKANKYSVRCIK
jgi:uncharacterized protein (TIGR02145 family)